MVFGSFADLPVQVIVTIAIHLDIRSLNHLQHSDAPLSRRNTHFLLLVTLQYLLAQSDEDVLFFLGGFFGGISHNSLFYAPVVFNGLHALDRLWVKPEFQPFFVRIRCVRAKLMVKVMMELSLIHI